MARRRYRRSLKSRSTYSHENKGFAGSYGTTLVNTFYQGGAVIVPATTTQGTRTVGNWTITVPVPSTAGQDIFWALVYVPQGETAKELFATTGTGEGSLYEPNQYVLASGVSDGSAGPIRIRSSIKRKLHSGDFVSLILAQNQTQGANFRGLVSYSIKYN